ncbi:MAG: hypothetical protein WA996_21280, partial [Candidatus Promineifilaceae bacterium]
MNMKRTIILLVFLFLISGCRQGRLTAGGQSDSEAATASGNEEAQVTPQPIKPPSTGTSVLADGQLVAQNPVLPLSFVVSGR